MNIFFWNIIKSFCFVGIDPRMWKQAIQDNPNSAKLIPVPIIGFNEVSYICHYYLI